MSDDANSNGGSPSKSGWVQFDDDNPDGAVNSKGHPLGDDVKSTPRSSSGVSSARGSVNSISDAANHSGASLTVSAIEVVDEETLRKKSVKESRSNNVRKNSEAELSNVNLEEEQVQTPAKTTITRGKQFGKKKSC